MNSNFRSLRHGRHDQIAKPESNGTAVNTNPAGATSQDAKPRSVRLASDHQLIAMAVRP
jgi:hypothetical protein